MITENATTRRTLDWSAAVWAGLIGGLVFMMLQMLLVATIKGGSPWGPPRMIAAIALGKGVLPPPATFNPSVMLPGMLIHFGLSVLFGLILAAVINRLTLGTALGVGAVFGLALYLVNFYGSTAVFPWFAMARGPITIFTHICFGIAAAWAYKGLAKPTVAAPA